MKKLKLFSLALVVLFTTSAWALTENNPTNASGDNDVTGTSYTIPATLVAGSANQSTGMDRKGVKTRTNKTIDGKSNVIKFAVNENYKITALQIKGTANSSTAITIGSYSVDNGSAVTQAVEFPTSSGTAVSYSITGINATSAIYLYVTSGSGQQLRMQYTITYEQLVECDDPEIAWATEPENGEVGDADFAASVTTTPADHAVTWTSSNTSVATVIDGSIHYVASGVTKITASLTYSGDDYCKKSVLVSKYIHVPIATPALGGNDRRWYFENEIPASNPINGLTYSDQGTISGCGLYGVKLNSTGWAWFAKPAGSGTLRIGAYYVADNANAYEVNVYACSSTGVKGDLISSLSIASSGSVSSDLEIDDDVEGIYIERNTQNEGVLYFVEFISDINCTIATTTFSAESTNIEIAKGASSASTTLSFSSNNESAATYTIKKGGSATEDASVSAGTFTATAAGTYVVTVNQEADGTHCAVAKSVTINVSDANIVSYLLIAEDTINTKDFFTGGTKASNKISVQGNDYTYLTLGGTASTTGQNAPNKYLIYNAKSTRTKIKAIVYNKNTSSSRPLMAFGVIEGTTDTIQFAYHNAIVKQTTDTVEFTFNNLKNRSVYFCVPSSNTDVCFLQIEAQESGEELKNGGEIGYSINLKQGRMVCASGAAYTFEGITYYLSSNYAVASSTEAKISTLGTQYIKFKLPVRTQVDITTTDATKYYVGSESSTGDAAKTNPTEKTGKSSFVLAAGTWYINGNGSNVKITSIEFIAPPVDPTSLDNTADEAKAVKFIENGMLIIEKNGVRYNAQGQVLR